METLTASHENKLSIDTTVNLFSISLEIFEKKAAFNCLNNLIFVKKWQALADQDSKFTVIQEPAFVISWYRQYRHEFDPILILGYRSDGQLIGLMPLARSHHQRTLTFAGDHQAEYAGWLANAEFESAFVQRSLQAIKASLNPQPCWTWRWLAPGTNPALLQTLVLNEFGIHCQLEKRPAPIWDLRSAEKMRQISKNRAYKSKFNRYKRQGDLRLEVVTDSQKTRALLAILSQQCDFRQEAVHGDSPFKEDPNKLDFYASLQNFPSANHFSVLWLDDRPLAFHFGQRDQKRICLGLSAYDPSESKNSPGTLLIIALGQQLATEGVEIFDLTPGTDAYKERFASGYQSLYRPTFYFDQRAMRKGRVKQQLIQGVENIAGRLGIGREQLLSWRIDLKEYLSLARIGAWQLPLNAIVSRLYKKQQSTLYEYKGEDILSVEVDSLVRVQAYEDLLTLPEVFQKRSRRGILKQALFHFAKGDYLLSCDQPTGEAVWGWLKVGSTAQVCLSPEFTFDLPEPGGLLYELRPNLTGAEQTRLMTQAMSLCQSHGLSRLYLLLPQGQQPVNQNTWKVRATIQMKTMLFKCHCFLDKIE